MTFSTVILFFFSMAFFHFFFFWTQEIIFILFWTVTEVLNHTHGERKRENWEAEKSSSYQLLCFCSTWPKKLIIIIIKCEVWFTPFSIIVLGFWLTILREYFISSYNIIWLGNQLLYKLMLIINFRGHTNMLEMRI